MHRDRVILVTEDDSPIGVEDKLRAHRQATLHRAFSVYILDSKGRLLIQQRAASKYHSGGQWSNACCSHPQPGELLIESAESRLLEEMGFTCRLTPVFTLRYTLPVGRSLIENEFAHVLIGTFDGVARPDPQEVSAFRWMPMDTLQDDMACHSEMFTPWFLFGCEPVRHYLLSGRTDRFASRLRHPYCGSVLASRGVASGHHD